MNSVSWKKKWNRKVTFVWDTPAWYHISSTKIARDSTDFGRFWGRARIAKAWDQVEIKGVNICKRVFMIVKILSLRVNLQKIKD